MTTHATPTPERLAELIRTQLLGVPHDEQDVFLEDADYRLILDALAAQPAAADDGWREIASAPRDGTLILVDTKPDEPTWMPFVARLINGHYDFPAKALFRLMPPRHPAPPAADTPAKSEDWR